MLPQIDPPILPKSTGHLGPFSTTGWTAATNAL